MKKIAIFEDCYDNCEDLEKDINEWIEQYKVKVIDMRVNPINYGHVATVENGETHRENKIFWYATVIYEE